MRTATSAAATLFFLAATAAYAQHDSTRYINGLPVGEDDTAQVSSGDLAPVNRITPIPPANLPARLRDALEEGDQYNGWQDTIIYREENTGLYLVPLKYEGRVKVFGLNERGHPVTFREVTVRDGP